MRLLECNEDGEFSLTEEYDDNIPSYAILSHRWGKDSEEVTFRDIEDRTGKSKAGYDKIRFCGKQAMCDGLRYFWVDTCCIDQSNSTELQEAINSMFRWYRNANKCYAYLSDVSTSANDTDESNLPPWESEFRQSKWFTRGWTLQELIAPRKVEFFSREGFRLGDKISLERQIHDITGIAVSALRGTPLSRFGDDEKFSWAKARETKKKEDAVYSLLGIFDVLMTPRYGEGREEAFIRLKRKIEKSLSSKTNDIVAGKEHKKRVLNWLSDTPYEKHHHHNSQRRSEGSGEWLLKTAKFKDWKTRPGSEILWLRGSPGAGKTFLSSRVVDSILQEKETTKSRTPIAYFYCSRASDDTKRGDPSNVLRSIAKQLAQPEESIPLADPVDRRYREIVDSDEERDLDIYETIDLIIELKDINSATIIIDGLDECNTQDGKRGALFQGLKAIASSPGKAVKIFVAGRDEYDINGAFSNYPYHFIDAQDNKADIRKYVEEQLEEAIQRRLKTSGRRISARLKTKIQNKLIDEAGGIFRWVGLQLQTLFDTNVNKLEGDMEHQLSKLPKDLKASYDVIYDQLLAQGTSSQKIAHKAISWLLCARQPISTLDFIQALNVGFDHPEINTKEEVIDICRNFVKHDEDLDRFRIFHLSVTNYFEDQRQDWPKELLNRVVADMCLEQCLSQHTRQQYQMPNRENKAFRDYANVYWPYHCSLAGEDQKLGILKVPLEDKLQHFLRGGQSTSREFARWYGELNRSIYIMDLNAKDIDSKLLTIKLQDSLDEYSPNPPSRAFVACAFGFSEIVKNMLDNGDDFTVRTQQSRLQPLYVAIRHDHKRIEEVIRERIPDNHSIYVRSLEIHAAVRTGKDTFVILLLDRHAENLITYGILEGAARYCKARTFGLLRNCVTGPMTQCDFWKEGLLVAAARNEEHGGKIVQLLLRELQTCNEEVYAVAASNENHGLSILRLLFNKFKPTRIDHQTVEAAASNHKTGRAILRLIFCQFPDWKPDEEVIITSAAGASFETFKILLNAFLPVHINQEVLVAAAGNEKSGLELVKLLLTNEFEVRDPDDVIIAAVENEKSGPELVKLLLTNKFEVTNLDKVIIAAIRNRNYGSEIVKELLENFQGVTPLVLETVTSRSFLDITPDIRVFKTLLLSLPLTLDDAIIESAASNTSFGSELINLFREVRKDDLATRSNLLAESLSGNYEIDPAILRDALCLAKNHFIIWDALWNAAMFPNAEFLSVYLDFVDAQEELSWLVEVTAANESCGGEMIEMIFERIPSLCITSEAIEIASQNKAHGDRIVEYLLGHDSEVDISIDAILAATKNRDKGKLVMHTLLPHFPGVVPLNEEITVACASNLAHALDLMEMLLEQNGTDWSEQAALTTIFGETLVQQGNFLCLKSFLGKVRDIGIGMALYQFGKSPRIDADLVEKLLEFCDDDFINHYLIYKVVSGEYHEDDLSVVQKLLPRLEPNSFSKQSIFKLAISRQEGAAQMLQLLQAERFNTTVERDTILAAVRSPMDVLVTLDFDKWVFKCDEEVLQVAVRNRSQGLRILQLLSRKDPSLEITEAVIIAAVQNEYQAVQVLELLWRKDDSLKITEAVIIAAVQNEYQAVQVLQFLWRKDPSLKITEVVLKAAAQSNQAIQALQFLWRKDPSLKITEVVLAAAAQNGTVQALQFLWRKDPSLKITEAVLTAAAKNREAVQALQFLWRKDPSLEITEVVLTAATKNYQAVQALQFLWRKDPSLEITETVLAAAAQNRGQTFQAIQFLLRKDPSLKITEVVLKAAAQSNQAIQALQFLWRKDPSLEITEVVLTAAAKSYQAVQALQFLWRKDPSLKITEAVLAAAAQNGTVQALQFLWRKDPSLKITEAVLTAAAKSYQAVQALQFLWRKDPSLKVTEAVLTAAAKNREAVQALQFLWRKDPSLKTTEVVLTAAAQNGSQAVQALQFLRRKDPSLKITEVVLMAAAQNGSQEVQTLQFLWRKDPSLKITEAVLTAAAQSWYEAVQTLRFLWRKDPSLKITEVVLMAAAQNVSQAVQVLEFLWRKDPSLKITKDVLTAAAQNRSQTVQALQFLWRKDSSLKITEAVLIATAKSYQAVQALQYLWRKDLSLKITEAVIIAAVRNEDQAVQVLEFLWRKDDSLKITEDVLKAAARSWNQAVQILEFLWRKNPSLNVTEAVLTTAARSGSQAVQVLQFLYRKDPSFNITEAVLMAAAQNGSQAVQVLEFLWRKDPSLKITKDVLTAAARNWNQAVQALGFLWRKDPSLKITEAVIIAAVRSEYQAVQVLEFIWRKDPFLKITEAVIIAAAQNEDQAVQALEFLWRKDDSLKITEAVLTAAAQNGYKAVQVLKFLQRKDPCLRITRPVLVAAVQNLLQAVPILKLLSSQLNEFGIIEQLLNLSNKSWDLDQEILKNHWKKRLRIFTTNPVFFSHLHLQNQQRKQVVNFLHDKRRCLQVAISVG